MKFRERFVPMVGVVAAFTLSGGAAIAQEQGKFYFGVDVGGTALEDQTSDLSSGLVRAVGGTASASQSKSLTNLKVFGGYKFSENVDLELGYFSTSTLNMTFSGRSSNNTAYSGSLNGSASGFEYSVNLRPSTTSGWNDLYFKLGATTSTLKTSLSVTGNSSIASSQNYSGTGAVYGLGYDKKIGTETKIRFGLTRYNQVGSSDLAFKGNVLSIGFRNDF